MILASKRVNKSENKVFSCNFGDKSNKKVTSPAQKNPLPIKIYYFPLTIHCKYNFGDWYSGCQVTPRPSFPLSYIISAPVGSEWVSFRGGGAAGAAGGAGGVGGAAALLEHIANDVQRGEKAPASNGEVEKMRP